MFLAIWNRIHKSEKTTESQFGKYLMGFPYGGLLYGHENDDLEKYTLSY